MLSASGKFEQWCRWLGQCGILMVDIHNSMENGESLLTRATMTYNADASILEENFTYHVIQRG